MWWILVPIILASILLGIGIAVLIGILWLLKQFKNMG